MRERQLLKTIDAQLENGDPVQVRVVGMNQQIFTSSGDSMWIEVERRLFIGNERLFRIEDGKHSTARIPPTIVAGIPDDVYRPQGIIKEQNF